MKTEVIDKLATLITASLGLVAALAWNDAIQSIFKTVYGSSSSIWAMVIYGLIVTVIAVVATIWIGRIAEKSKQKLCAEEKKE